MTVPSSSGRLYGSDFLNISRFKCFVDVVLFSRNTETHWGVARPHDQTGLERQTHTNQNQNNPNYNETHHGGSIFLCIFEIWWLARTLMVTEGPGSKYVSTFKQRYRLICTTLLCFNWKEKKGTKNTLQPLQPLLLTNTHKNNKVHQKLSPWTQQPATVMPTIGQVL